MKRDLLFFIVVCLCLSACTTKPKSFTLEEKEAFARICATADSLLTPAELEIKETIQNDFWDLFYKHVSFDSKYNMVFDGKLEDFVERGLDPKWYYLTVDNVKMNNKNMAKIASGNESVLREMAETFERQKKAYQESGDKSIQFDFFN